MSFLVFAAALLGALFLWGLFWPRSQWHVLASWIRRNPDASEPGAIAYAFHRILCGLGVGTYATVAIVAGVNYVESLPAPEPPQTALQQMWGPAPRPIVVDRVITSAAAPDPRLGTLSLLGYQRVDNVAHTPRYLAFLESYQPPGDPETFIGKAPSARFSALDSAELVVNVRVKAQCAPVEAIVVETAEVVQVSVAAAVVAPVGTSPADPGFCAGGSTVGPSLLIPLNLAEPVGEREVQLLDGTPLREVEAIEPD